MQPFESKVYLEVFDMYFVVSILQAATMAWEVHHKKVDALPNITLGG